MSYCLKRICQFSQYAIIIIQLLTNRMQFREENKGFYALDVQIYFAKASTACINLK